MKSGGRGATAGHERMLVQRLMVAMQIAMAVVMLVAALLFVGSFRNLMSVDTGMRHEGISLALMRFPESIVPGRFDDFRRDLLAEITSVPGIVNAGTTSNTPLLGGSWSHGIRAGAVQESAQFTWVSPGYFATMGIPVLRGRDFSLRDTRTSPRVAIVNETFVKRFAGGADPIGQTLRTGEEPRYPSTLYEIVGVIPDTQYNDLRGERRAMVFGPDSQHPSPGPGAGVMIHSSVAPAVAIGKVRDHIARRYPDAIAEFSVFETRIRDGLVRERLLAMLAGFFGVLAVVLTVVGLYGMLSYVVAQRRPEIGVRVALGARRIDVLGLVMSEAGKLVLVGVVGGLGLSLLAGRSVASLLFGIKPNDPLLLASACVMLGIIAAIASFLPARRATRVDPAQLLREGSRDSRSPLRVSHAAEKSQASLIVAVLTLALGIGANTAMFAVVNAVLLKPLPFRDPERLMLVHLLAPGREAEAGTMTEAVWSYPKYRTFLDIQQTFENTALFAGRDLNLSGDSNPERVRGEVVTDRYPGILGITPILGRGFTGAEAHRAGEQAVVMIGHALWTRRYSADPAIVGRTIHDQLSTVHRRRCAACRVQGVDRQRRGVGAVRGLRTELHDSALCPRLLPRCASKGERTGGSGDCGAWGCRNANRCGVQRVPMDSRGAQRRHRSIHRASTVICVVRRWCCSVPSDWCC